MFASHLAPTQWMHCLPVEILTEIFLFCLVPKTGPLSTPPSVCSSQAPLLLCHVCSSWRQLALQTPALWTSLTIKVLPEDTLVVAERHSESASCWFSRSKSHLIELEIGQYAYLQLEEYEDIYSANFMIELVRPQAERIRSLCLSFQDFHDLCCVLQYQDREESLPHHAWSFPNLEYLTLNLHPYDTDNDGGSGNRVLTALESMPKLRTVVLNYVTMSNEPNINLPWAQLTCLVMENVTESLWRILLTQCPALETGCFAYAERDPEETLPTVDVILKRLNSLALDFHHPSDPSIFDGIHLPALRELSLYMTDPITSFAWTAPEHMFLQLAFVTKLTLGKEISARATINLFRAMTNVTTLSIEFSIVHIADVFAALTLGGRTDETLLPKLDAIWVQTSSICGHEVSNVVSIMAALVKMAASRSPSDAGPFGLAPLREVLLDTIDTTLRADFNAILEQWSHKTDMP